MRIDRRLFLGSAAAAGIGLLTAPQVAVARAMTERRFVFIIQRGAADGLSIVPPVGDPAFAALRGTLTDTGGTKLDSLFALHPALAETGRMYGAGEALFVHAVASPYRDRSHFDGQNVLETGGTAAYQLRDGWMNRLLGLLPQAEAKAIAVSATVPVALRGSREVGSYAPSNLPAASEDLLARVGELYRGDRQLAPLWAEAMATRKLTSDLGADRNAAATGALAARLLSGPEGDRIALIETGGWDTHSGQKGRLAAQLRGLDALLAALKAGLGPAWSDTLVLVATEFGRTAAPNGTNGTDHGTGAAAMLLGGAVKGGRVVSDWPGLRPAQLYEQRDLRPTQDLDALIASALAQHYALDPARVMAALFPHGAKAKPIEGLIRA
jgi:uncharacterized protein (DUF1501 family)